MKRLPAIPMNLQRSDKPRGPGWSGQALQMPIGPSEKVWDVVALVRYPSAGAYLTMVATEAYKAARQHRTAALCDSRLIMTAEHASLG